MTQTNSISKTVFLSCMALIAFAGNSVLCRLALSDQSIDPAGFTIIRLLSGIAALWPLMFFTQGKSKLSKKELSKKEPSKKEPSKQESTGSWFAASMLFVYALLFSYAYVSIATATGALV